MSEITKVEDFVYEVKTVVPETVIPEKEEVETINLLELESGINNLRSKRILHEEALSNINKIIEVIDADIAKLEAKQQAVLDLYPDALAPLVEAPIEPIEEEPV